jgi:D-aminoacyl-tRNA deacylase
MSGFSCVGKNVVFRKTLLVATTKDIASLNIANAVSSMPMWQKVGGGSETVWKSDEGRAVLWLQNESLLRLDNPQNLVPALSSEEKDGIEEVIFLSRHSAASGVASLTVHPIGVAWLKSDECEKYGGKGGRCSPPSSRIGRIYRNLLAETKKRGLEKTFEVTMEATHHGPFTEIPTCFVEIGSDEKTWPNEEAASVWADLLKDELAREPDNESNGMVVALLGGGHYIPKMNDCARLGEDLYVGHSIASYGLQNLLLQASTFVKEEGGEIAGDEEAVTWKSVVMECISSTQLAHPNRRLVVLIDKKAFKADGRALLTGLMDDLGIPYAWSVSDIKKMYQQGDKAEEPLEAEVKIGGKETVDA